MAELWQPSLRYRWGDREPQEAPVLPKAETVGLLVGERVVWQGDVAEELRAWARWCALVVADLWGCPEGVQHFLRTGEEQHRQAAMEAASCAVRDAFRGPIWKLAWDMPWFFTHHAADAVAITTSHTVVGGIADAIRRATAPAVARMHVAEAARRLVWTAANATVHATSRDEAWSTSGHAADHASRAAGLSNNSLVARGTAEVAQANQLRRLLLQRALPQPQWPLIDGDEGVLCDALLEGHRG